MPRVIQAGRVRNSTAKAILLKPYDRPNTPYAFDDESTGAVSPKLEEVKDDNIKAKKEPRSKPSGKGEYNKLHLVALIIKPASPDWDSLSKSVGKTSIHTWRKTICPALLAGKTWSNSGPGWDEGMKIKAVLEVVGSTKPDWAVLGNIMGGKTAKQVKDVWRKVIFPRLKKGMTVE